MLVLRISWDRGKAWGGEQQGGAWWILKMRGEAWAWWQMFIKEPLGDNPGGNFFCDDWSFVLGLICSLVRMLRLS